MIFYELRDGPDDLPYAGTWDTQRAAVKAAQAKANRRKHEVQVWSVSNTHGEYYCGAVEPNSRAW